MYCIRRQLESVSKHSVWRMEIDPKSRALRAILASVDSPLMASGQERTRRLCQHIRGTVPLTDSRNDGLLPTREQTNRTDRLSIF